tara:strand:- start:162 stop:815 length:654 start_codon:yes stop_codon:yes gene_type:complete
MKGKIFNAQEVQAIIAGNKTVFREVIKPQLFDYKKATFFNGKAVFAAHDLPVQLVKCPYQVGQKIFVKESFREHAFCKHHFKADDKERKWSMGSITKNFLLAQRMKQEHSRLTLEITDIKVERFAEISKEDAIKEGATSRRNCHGYGNRYEGWCMNWNKVGEASKWASNRKTLSESDVCMGSAQYAFVNFWNATHKKPEEKFEANPWVWVVNFKINK